MKRNKRPRGSRRKLKRKQPRRLNPPLALREEQSGDRHILEVDHDLVTTARCLSGRVLVYLTLGPGLRVRIGSRCRNKRRVTTVSIERADAFLPASAAIGEAFRLIAQR